MPNWKDPKAYDRKFDRAGWAWEFMRRSPKYRADYELVAQAWKAVPRKGHLFRGMKASHVEATAWQLGAKWGLLGPIVDPSCDRAPSFILHGPIQPDGEQVLSFYCGSDDTDMLVQRPEFATLTFDLRRPLRPQIGRAETVLRRRKKGVKSIRPVRSSEKQWPLYLRVLDAKDARAKTSEIIKSIKAYSILEHYAALDRVSDHLKAARKLRDNPLALIL
jgi:hypothetical protein